MDGTMQQSLHISRLRHLAFVYSLTLVYLFLVQITMPPELAGLKREKAIWNEQETAALISFLRTEAGRTGSTRFSATSFNAAAEVIRSHHTTGPSKTAKHRDCKTKWKAVSR
jgi:hypothetical protein